MAAPPRASRSPWHPGELEVQVRTGGGSSGGAIRDAIAYSHRVFFESLPFVALATLDDDGPIATLLTGSPGFVSVPEPRTVRVDARIDPLDPAASALRVGGAVGLLGIDLGSARRSRINGVVTAVSADGLELAVRQSFGNCPMYIQVRDVEPAPRPSVASPPEAIDPLDDDARRMIASADTFFVASAAFVDEATGGVDISHRGGRPGFVKVYGDELTIPDFRGNRYFNTLGNLVANPHAALLFVDFERGDLLHLQGTTEIIWDGSEVRAFEGAERLWKFRITGAIRQRGKIALRWVFRELAPTTIATGTWG